MKLTKLQTKRKLLTAKIRKLYPNVIRGTVVTTQLTCGKPNCHCQAGRKHIVHYITLKLKGKSKIFYIKKNSIKKASIWSKNYQKTKSIVDKLTLLNIKILQNISKNS